MLSRERLKQELDYNPDTGVFRWIAKRQGVRFGAVAGSKHSCGYLNIRLDGTLYFAHRLAWLYVHGSWPVNEIDHKNCRRDDNRISNLRDATRFQQIGNCSLPSHNTHGAKGVYFDGRPKPRTKRWYAQICKGRKQVHLGHFLTFEEAKEAYAKAAAEYFGSEYARSA